MYDDRVLYGDIIASWFSCGVASAVALKLTIDLYGKEFVRPVNNPVAEEHEDNPRFKGDIENWLGVKIETATNSKYPSCSAVDVWAKKKFMSGPLGAPCTIELKKEARKQWEEINKPDWHVLGFTADEVVRHERFILGERENVLSPLIDANITKQDCFEIIRKAGIELPKIYKLGYPNANCIGCVKATSPEYWNHVRRVHPDVFKQRAEQSREIGSKLARYKGERVYLDELPPDAKGRPMKNMKIDCGIFCEEKEF